MKETQTMYQITSQFLEENVLTILIFSSGKTVVTLIVTYGPNPLVTDIRVVESSEYFVVLNFPVVNTLHFAAAVIDFLIQHTCDAENDAPMVIGDPVAFLIGA